MRAALAAVLVLLLAGCIGLPFPKPGGGTSALVYVQDCSIRADDWPDACTARASRTQGPKEEIMLAVNPKDAANVVIGSKDLNPDSSNHCVWNGLAVTKDAGRTWHDVTIGGTFASRTPDSSYYGFACNTDPDLAFARDGSLYYLVEMYNFGAEQAQGPTGANQYQPGWKFVLARSEDGGFTWPTTTVLDTSPGIVAVLDYSRQTVSPKTGTVVSAISTFSDLNAYQSVAPYSVVSVVATRAKGTQADAPQIVAPAPSDPTSGPPNVEIGDVAAAPDGSFTMLLMTSAYDKTTDAWLARSTDDAKTWSAPTKAFTLHATGRYANNTKFRTGSHLELAYGLDGSLYTTYAANDTGNSDVFVRVSHDNGATWSAPVAVGADAAKHAQFHPNVAVTSDGGVHLLFFDRAYDAADRLLDITYAESLDGGANWTTKRVTSESFDGDLGRHQTGIPFIGDYLGIDAVGHDVWLGFPDTVTGTSVIAAAHFALR
ncbi:MAG: sialidase family protein [Thermoplasmatota archaeon]